MVLIPHLHPGRLRHGTYTHVTLHVILLTYFLTLVYIQGAIEKALSQVTKKGEQSRNPVLQRYRICQEIMLKANQRLVRINFFDAFDKAKRVLEAAWASERIIEQPNSVYLKQALLENSELSEDYPYRRSGCW